MFYDLSVDAAVLHNKIVDWGLQPALMAITVVLYVVTGVKIIQVRNKVQTQQGQQSTNLRKSKLENRLFLQGLLVTLPHVAVIIFYHIIFYCPNAPQPLLDFLDFCTYVCYTLGLVLNPTLHLFVNKDLRVKTVQCFCFGTLTAVEQINTQFVMGSRSGVVSRY